VEVYRVITKILVSAAILLGPLAVGVAPANADTDPDGSQPNPFSSLTCDCQQIPAAPGPGLTTEIDRGIWSALAVADGPPQRS
jgi:hypothetical protein